MRRSNLGQLPCRAGSKPKRPRRRCTRAYEHTRGGALFVGRRVFDHSSLRRLQAQMALAGTVSVQYGAVSPTPSSLVRSADGQLAIVTRSDIHLVVILISPLFKHYRVSYTDPLPPRRLLRWAMQRNRSSTRAVAVSASLLPVPKAVSKLPESTTRAKGKGNKSPKSCRGSRRPSRSTRRRPSAGPIGQTVSYPVFSLFVFR